MRDLNQTVLPFFGGHMIFRFALTVDSIKGGNFPCLFPYIHYSNVRCGYFHLYPYGQVCQMAGHHFVEM